jgi:anti-sigma regulatory factor (Ser/Thr protein kinase)
MEFRISDTGTPMAAWPEQICPDFDPRDIGRLPEGCMGLYLIRSIMDETRYDSLEGRNTLTMIRRRPARSLPGGCTLLWKIRRSPKGRGSARSSRAW